MARNGSGTYTNPYPNFVSGTVISSSEVDANNSDIATALTQSIAVDGQAVVTAHIPLATHKLTGVSAGSAATDSLNLGQAQAEAFIWCGTAGGSADAITLSPSPAITAYAAGQRFVWMASGSVNTGATTVAISGLGAIALQDNGAALVAGNHAANKMFMGILNTTSTVQIMQVQISGTDPLLVSSLTVSGDALIGDDLTLNSDAAVLGFGENTDVTLTHVHDTGLLLNGAMQLQFSDSSQYINAPSATVLDINATDEIELNATLADINANLEVSGTSQLTGITTHGGDVVSDSDSTDSLGTTSVRWAGTWTDAINGVTAPTAQYTSAEETKLSGIEASADVTDSTNVLAGLVGQEAVATGFTGTLDGVLGGGSAAAASVTTLTIANTLKMAKGGDIPSASPLVIDTDGSYFDVTGTTNFAAMTVAAGAYFMLQFDGVLTITHGSGIEIPGGANLTTAAGDRLICYATAADTVEVMNVATEAASGASGDLEAANNLSDVASAATSYGNIKQAASTTATGAIEIATDAETNTGTATDRAITPANLTQRAMLQGEKELWIPAGAMIPRVTNGPSSGLYESSTNKVMSRTLDFDASTSEYAQFNVAFPNSWNEGTITAEFYWTAASGSGNVLWGIAGVAVADDGILDASFGTRQTIVDALTATGDLMKSAATSAVTIKDTPANGKMTYFQMDRDADDGSDTFSADARLVGITIRYTVNVGNDA